LDFFTPQHLLDRFHKGETSVSMEYLRLMPDGKPSWVSTTTTMMEVLETKQILAYMYTENLSAQQLEAAGVAALPGHRGGLCHVRGPGVQS
jgi:hypothetical protein